MYLCRIEEKGVKKRGQKRGQNAFLVILNIFLFLHNAAGSLRLRNRDVHQAAGDYDDFADGFAF